MLVDEIIKKAKELDLHNLSNSKHNEVMLALIKINLDYCFNLYIIELNKDSKSALCLMASYEIQVGYFDLDYVLDNCSHAKIDDTFIPTYINEIYKNENRKLKSNF